MPENEGEKSEVLQEMEKSELRSLWIGGIILAIIGIMLPWLDIRTLSFFEIFPGRGLILFVPLIPLIFAVAALGVFGFLFMKTKRIDPMIILPIIAFISCFAYLITTKISL